MIKNMNSKMTTNSQLSTTKPEKKKQPRNELSKQLEQGHNHRNGELSVESRKGMSRGKAQGIRSINGRYKYIGMLRIVWEMEKPKNLYVGPIDMN